MTEIEPGCDSQKPECGKSPTPPKYYIPDLGLAGTAYYEGIPVAQRRQIDAEKARALNDALEKSEEANAKARDLKQLAQAEYGAAESKKNNDIGLVDLKCKNKKIVLGQNYINKLLEQVPKGCAVNSDDPETIGPKLKKEKWAICIAEFHKALADESFDYQNKLNAIDAQWADAKNKWKKAEAAHSAAICSAKAAYEQAILAADVVWRTKISEQLQLLCKMD